MELTLFQHFCREDWAGHVSPQLMSSSPGRPVPLYRSGLFSFYVLIVVRLLYFKLWQVENMVNHSDPNTVLSFYFSGIGVE
jgi:hypothetical protein